METMTIQWQKCNDYPFLGRWCRLDSEKRNPQKAHSRPPGIPEQQGICAPSPPKSGKLVSTEPQKTRGYRLHR